MVLTDVDRKILRRCLDREPRAWEDFVDRFLGLVIHVIRHTAQTRMLNLSDEDVEDLVADVFMALVKDDFAVLRRFKGHSSLATYLTVISRRITLQVFRGRKLHAVVNEIPGQGEDWEAGDDRPEKRITDREQVEKLLRGLNGPEADVVRLYHLEGRSYDEISSQVGMPRNSVGPTLSRAREKMRRANGSGK